MRPQSIYTWPVALVLLFCSSAVWSLERLSVGKLKSLCQDVVAQQKSPDSGECSRYIKGIVDGLILASQFNHSLTPPRATTRSDFEERIVDSRIKSRLEHNYMAANQSLCLEGDKQLKHIVDTIAQHVIKQDQAHLDARYVVYDSLQTHFKCR